LIPTGPSRESKVGDAARRTPVDVFFPDPLDSAAVPGEAVDVSRETSVTAEGSGNGATAGGDLALLPVAGARFAEVPVVESIREVGLLQPVVVRALQDGRFELVVGERRWRATQHAGLAMIPVIVRDTHDDAMLRDALLENLHRVDLNPLEEAAAYQQLLDDFGGTHEELATRIKRSRPQISNTLRLLRLPPVIQRRVAAGVLSAGHARALLGLADAAAQERLAHRIVAEGLSVRSVEEIVALGEDAVPKQRPQHSPRPVAPRLADIAASLSERLDTRVKVDLGRSKGKVTIEFASIDDLERIVSAIAPDAPGAAAGENRA
jgi:ParB family chromosome partitioning protein